MKTSDSICNINKAMSQAQAEMKPAPKDANNPHYKSKFTTLFSVWESIREPLTKNGITVWQDVISNNGDVSIFTRLSHVSGEWVEFGPLTIPLTARKDAQAIGSAISYAKRYSLCAAVGVVSDEDDDGEAAVGRNRMAHDSEQTDKPVQTLTPQKNPNREAPIASNTRLTLDQVRELQIAIEKCPDPQFIRSEICRVAKANDFSLIDGSFFEGALKFAQKVAGGN